MVKPTEVTVVLRCKVAVCGDAAVGKSALISMFTSKGQKFPKAYSMTSGVEVIVAPVPVPDTTAMVELFLFDTAGNDLYKDSVSQYWNGVYYAILVYDVTDADSFEACKSWYEELKRARLDRERPIRAVVVATKTDLPAQRHQASPDVAQDWATGHGMEFFEVSSVSGPERHLPPGKDVDLPFLSLAKSFHRAYEESVASYTDTCRNY
ncbi:MAG: hypothetical protein WDW36_007397 [Sanguina aurantia]